jgi:hypothetical protein
MKNDSAALAAKMNFGRRREVLAVSLQGNVKQSNTRIDKSGVKGKKRE